MASHLLQQPEKPDRIVCRNGQLIISTAIGSQPAAVERGPRTRQARGGKHRDQRRTCRPFQNNAAARLGCAELDTRADANELVRAERMVRRYLRRSHGPAVNADLVNIGLQEGVGDIQRLPDIVQRVSPERAC